MFLLKELPNEKILHHFSKNYSEMNIDNLMASLHLLKTSSEILRELEKHFAKFNLSQARFFALIIIVREENPELTAVQIADMMGISKPNICRLLSSLEDDEYIRRSAHENDKRASTVEITAKGKKKISQMLPGYYNIMNKAMNPLDQKTKINLIKILNQIDIQF
jgi:DNA-binding MarR family transcriptional regulator